MSSLDKIVIKSTATINALVAVTASVGNISISGNTISGDGNINIIPNGVGEVVVRANPLLDLGVATKQYVDNAISGLTFKDPVHVATESALPSYTQSGSGIGATLTATSNGSINSTGIDDVTNLVLNDRILVKTDGSTSDQHNGVYTLTQVGDGSNPWILTRALDFDEDIEVVPGSYILLSQGTVNKGVSYVVSNTDIITVDVTAITFARFAPSTGENNTASNVGNSGVGIFKQKNVEDMEFKNLVSNSTHITVTDNTGNNTVDLAFDSSEITAVGALTSGSLASGFGDIDIGSSILTAGATTVSQLNTGNIHISVNTLTSTDTNGNINLFPNGSGELIAKADPISDLGVATKQYVDNSSSGLSTKDPARVTTSTSLDTYTQSGAGVGATLTASTNGSINNNGIDGITDLALSDRVLVRGPGTTSDTHNGMYTITQIGDGSNPWILTRAVDFDDASEIQQGTYVLITDGTYQGSSWTVANDVIAIDTTIITFTQFTVPSASVVASNVGNNGVGVFRQKTGNVLEFRNINSTNSLLSISLDAVNNEIDLTVDQSVITGTGVLNSGSITSGFGTINNGASSITTTGIGSFGSIAVDNINVDGSVVTYNGATGDNLIKFPFNLADGLSIEDTNTNTYMHFVSTSGALEVKVLQNVNVTGTIVTTSNVNGRNMSLDGTQHDAVWATGIADMTAVEVNQLENINTTTISAVQWAYLGATNQGISTSDAVGFTEMVLSNGKLDFTAASNIITIPDNLANGLSVVDAGGADYMRFITTNAVENIEILQSIDFSDRLMFKDITAPTNPTAGQGLLYKKTGDDGLYWKPDASGVVVDLTCAPQYKRTVVTNVESPYIVLATDEIIGVDSTDGTVTITLPLISGIGGSSNYRKYYIVDESGTSALNNITVVTNGSDTINKNADDMLIDIDHTSITLYNDGISNWIIL